MLLRRFLKNRRGASEIVGTAMFLVILVFFFSNVYLWHDQATREMDQVVGDRMNSGIRVEVTLDDDDLPLLPLELRVVNDGGLDVTLSRLWIITDDYHLFADFEFADFESADFGPMDFPVAVGRYENITLSGETVSGKMEGSVRVRVSVGGSVIVDYGPPPEATVVFRVITKRANSAACNLGPLAA